MTFIPARPFVRVVFLAGALLVQACSLISTRSPPNPYIPTQDPNCTTDRTPPLVDAVIGGLAVVGVIGLAANPPQDGTDNAGAIAAGAVAAAGFGASSGLGYYRTHRCEEAQKLWRVEKEKRDAADQAVASAQRSQPFDRAGLQLINGHSDLLVSVVAFIPETKEEFAVLRDHRIGMAETQNVGDVLKGRDGKRIVFSVKVLSLGEWREAGAIDTRFRADDLLLLKVEWDHATAQFRATAGWTERPGATGAGQR